MEEAFYTYTVPEIIAVASPIVLLPIPYGVRRKRPNLIAYLNGLDDAQRLSVTEAARRAQGTKRKAKGEARTSGAKRPRLSAAPPVTPPGTPTVSADSDELATLLGSSFLEPVSDNVVKDCISRYIDRTSNEALRKELCMVCARRLFMSELQRSTIEGLPNRELLLPTKTHPAHILTQGLLLHRPALTKPVHFVCTPCLNKLKKNQLPPLSLANGMWVGDTPFALSILTLPERLLVALYFPAAYVVKLYPKVKGARNWNKDAINSGMRGNVSTYRLNTAQIAEISTGNTMPPSPKILAAMIGVTFVGTGTKPLHILPDFLRVRRQRVFEALLWLRDNNSLYSGIDISADQLRLLPEDDVPEEITLNAKYSDDVAAVEREQAGYVPDDVEDEEEEAALFVSAPPPANAALTMTNLGLPSGDQPIVEDDDVINATDAAYQEFEPAVFPLQPMGVVDAHAEDVPDNDLFAHAFANVAESRVYKDFAIRRSSAFVNEYARLDEHQRRFDGGPGNPNHMLGAFPVLFPYGQGGVEVDREVNVPYETHVRWALQYDDSRFRKDFYFIFQAFGVLQKRQVCRSASIQIKRSSFIANQVAFMQLRAKDFLLASREETRRVPFANPVVRKLRETLTSVRARVEGTDESRVSIRSQVWGTNLRFNPPTIWATWNMSDTGDPIAQVLVGEEIDLDQFMATAGPNRTKRAVNIAGDPYAAAEFFHRNVAIILEEVMGIKVPKRGHVERHEGILGIINAYIATVEAQARGTLHLHVIFWVDGAPSAEVMRAALQRPEFRERLARFIKQNIRADIKGTDAQSLLALKKERNIAYSRPVDPRGKDYERLRQEAESRIARAVQTHKCLVTTCLRTKNGRLVCKRRAPWALSSEDWVQPNGEWGPRRLYGYLNAWNPVLLQLLRSNQDMKLITNGGETKDITFYITLYIAKRQIQAANASALLAKSVAMHEGLNRRQAAAKDINKRMLQQCANTLSRQHEFSGPEVVSYLMGWGDRFISHNFVAIYWDQVTAAIRRAFPHLRAKTDHARVAASLGIAPSATEREPEKEGTVQLRMVDGQFVLKDQLKEYTDRGEELNAMSFYDYFVETYDGPMLKNKETEVVTAEDGDGDEPQSDVESPDDPIPAKAGRPASRRVPYLPSAKRKQCRVFRGPGFETCLQFIGTWFPRSDGDDREYYSANMLALLRPWRTLQDLNGDQDTFAAAFDVFIQTASSAQKRVIANIQYFHECSDGSQKKRDSDGAPGGAGGAVALDDSQRRAADLAELNAMDVELCEADVQNARNNRYAAREYLYGLGAVAVAKDLGIFSDERPPTCFRPAAARASMDEYGKYQEWKGMVAAITRAPAYVVDNTVSVAPTDAEVVPAVLAPPAHHAADAFGLEPLAAPPRTPEQQKAVDILNVEQRRAHDIIEQHLRRTLAGQQQDQLLMIVRGEGGTGKTVLLNAISHTFDHLEAASLLAKTATTGVAASLIGGQTVHSWAGIPVGVADDPTWMTTASAAMAEKRKRNIIGMKYLEIDEFSMMTKRLLAQLSQVVGAVKATAGEGTSSLPFGGANVIMFGDPHQFPPVGNAKGALYCHGDVKLQAQIGLEIYHQFTAVVTLTEQKRITDLPWKGLLQRLRIGACNETDMTDLRALLVTDPSAANSLPSWQDEPWCNAVLVTPRHGSRMQWNTEALMKHCSRTGNRLYVCPAEDTAGRHEDALSLPERVIVAGMTQRQTGKLAERVEIAIGMRAMVLLNLATEADLANGTRGQVVDLKLDPREDNNLEEDPDTGAILLRYPPAVVFFKPDTCSFPPFEGLPPGILPIVPSKMGFSIKMPGGTAKSIKRRQLAMTPGYAFTDYKSQGQTLEFVLVDLQPPPTAALTPFSAYVALSRSRGRGTIRLLRGFDPKLFTTHPSEELRAEDARLDKLTRQTKQVYA